MAKRTDKTMDYALVGEKLPYTISPRIHELFGRKYGIVEIPTIEDLHTFFESLDFKGLNVTMPYKIEAMPFLDFIDFNAKEVGSINTIVKRNNMLYGYNTDYIGLEYALKRAKITLTGKDVIILGSGGASKTAKYISAVKSANSINIISRTGAFNYDNIYSLNKTQIIINTTPVGTYPNLNKCLIDLSKFPDLEAVVDLIYNPMETRLLYDAKLLGLKTTNGLSMLVEQARASENIFSFVDDIGFLGINDTERVLDELYRENTNIALIGMPGVGKSTIGKKLAMELDMPFIDIDEEIEKKEGMSIPEIFKTKGEEYFRDVETELIKTFLVKKAQVIALGGGAILRDENRYFIRANSMVINLLRDLKLCQTDGRPLSKNLESLIKLFKEREKLYIETRDFDVYNENIESTTKEIKEIYEKNISIKWS